MHKKKIGNKPKLTWRIKHIAREVARACDLPYETAYKLVQDIIKLWQIKLRSEGLLQFKGLGYLRVSKLKTPNNRAAYKIITFKMYKELDKFINSRMRYRHFEFEIDQARKIRRLLLTGIPADKLRALRYTRKLNERLLTRPEATKYLLDRNLWPPSTWI